MVRQTPAPIRRHFRGAGRAIASSATPQYFVAANSNVICLVAVGRSTAHQPVTPMAEANRSPSLAVHSRWRLPLWAMWGLAVVIAAIMAGSALVANLANSAEWTKSGSIFPAAVGAYKNDALLDGFAQAACKGDPLADLHLAEALFFGQGVRRDVARAYVHARRAKTRLDGENTNLASALTSMIAANMTTEQRNAAELTLHGADHTTTQVCGPVITQN